MITATVIFTAAWLVRVVIGLSNDEDTFPCYSTAGYILWLAVLAIWFLN